MYLASGESKSNEKLEANNFLVYFKTLNTAKLTLAKKLMILAWLLVPESSSTKESLAFSLIDKVKVK